jgi:hypothetical protein
MLNQEHLTMEGLAKIVNIKASTRGGVQHERSSAQDMNSGILSEIVLSLFPSIEPVKRPKRTDVDIKDPNWVIGFVEGEGMFAPSGVFGFNMLKTRKLCKYIQNVQLLDGTREGSKRFCVREGVKLVFKITQTSAACG